MALNLCKKNKKAVFFTFMALTLVTLIVLSFSGIPSIPFMKNKDVVESEFVIINSYVKDVKKNFLPDLIYTQSLNAINALLNEVNRTDEKIDDVDAVFYELLTEAEFEGDYSPEMKNITIYNWTSSMDEKALELLGIRSNISIQNITLSQVDPWALTVDVDVIINVSRGDMSYFINDTVSVNLSIIGLGDPVYMFNNTEHFIIPTSYTRFDRNIVEILLENETYRYSEYAPSFLMRLEGDYRSSYCCGIESLVNEDYLFGADGDDMNASFVDYLFFSKSNRSCTSGDFPLFEVDGITGDECDGFKLDSAYLDFYNLTDYKDTLVCTP